MKNGSIKQVSRDKSAIKFEIGYDANKDVYTDMFKAGIIDPVKVVASALQNAVSTAALLLTTEAAITDAPEKKEDTPPMPPMGGGMPMM